MSPHKPGEVDAAVRRPYLGKREHTQHSQARWSKPQNDATNVMGNEPQERGGNTEKNMGPQQVHGEWNNIQDPVNVSQSKDSFQTIMSGGIAHVAGQPRSKKPRKFSYVSLICRKV